MMHVTVRASVPTFVLSDDAGKKLAKLFRDTLKAQAKNNLNGDGRLLKGKTGKLLDLFETGRMWNTADIQPLRVSLAVAYARSIIEEYNAGRLCERYLQDFFLPKALPIIAAGLVAKG